MPGARPPQGQSCRGRHGFTNHTSLSLPATTIVPSSSSPTKAVREPPQAAPMHAIEVKSFAVELEDRAPHPEGAGLVYGPRPGARPPPPRTPPMRLPVALLSATLLACGAPTATGPDAGAPTDGGAPDGGPRDAGVDAGAADAGPEEPRLSSAILWRETFDGYASTAALFAAYPDSLADGGVLAMEGSAARIDYPSDGGCGDATVFVAKRFASGDVPELVVTTSFRLSPGFLHLQPPVHCGGGAGATEFLLSRPGDGPGRVSVEARLTTEGLGYVVKVGALEYTQQAWREVASPGVLADDAWHRLTLFIARESAAGQGDGVLRLWVDGRAVLEVPRAQTGVAPFESLAVPGVLEAGAWQAQTRWVDDVAAFTP